MIGLNISPLAGRYHATPWGQQVNEGAVEWPPSPWRLLRALIATWHHKTNGDISAETMGSLIETLAGTLPEFLLPVASTGHTRHYMPYLEGRKQGTTKVFDTFAHVGGDGAIRVRWNMDLSGDQQEALQTLVRLMNYFGRAESLVEVVPSEEPFSPNAYPVNAESSSADEDEIVRLLAPYPVQEYRAWRDGFLEGEGTEKKGKGRGKKKSAEPPSTLFQALQVDTDDWKAVGWNRPPGSRWVGYWRPRHAFSGESVGRSKGRTTTAIQVARFTLAGNVLPSIREALSVAERIHRSLVKISDSAPIFTGRSDSGDPLTGHQHAFILCEPDSSGQWITEVSIYVPGGFDDNARRAVEMLRGLWGRGGHNLKVVLSFLGSTEEAASVSPLFACSREWSSLTPFVPTRHPKSRRTGKPKLDETGLQIGSPEHDLRRLIKAQGLPVPEKIEPVPRYRRGTTQHRWLQFLQSRWHGEGRRATNQFGKGFELEFSEPVPGPLAFGYGAHFGLGLFDVVE